jgi:transposase
MERKKRRRFNAEFKADAVRLVLEEGRSITSVAKALEIPNSCLSNWVQQAEADKGEGAPGALTSAEKRELVQLRRKVKQLETEREILKKAAAFFAKESGTR